MPLGPENCDNPFENPDEKAEYSPDKVLGRDLKHVEVKSKSVQEESTNPYTHSNMLPNTVNDPR